MPAPVQDALPDLRCSEIKGKRGPARGVLACAAVLNLHHLARPSSMCSSLKALTSIQRSRGTGRSVCIQLLDKERCKVMASMPYTEPEGPTTSRLALKMLFCVGLGCRQHSRLRKPYISNWRPVFSQCDSPRSWTTVSEVDEDDFLGFIEQRNDLMRSFPRFASVSEQAFASGCVLQRRSRFCCFMHGGESFLGGTSSGAFISSWHSVLRGGE